MRVKCLAQEHNAMSPARGLNPGPLDPESSALTMKTSHLSNIPAGTAQNFLAPFHLQFVNRGLFIIKGGLNLLFDSKRKFLFLWSTSQLSLRIFIYFSHLKNFL